MKKGFGIVLLLAMIVSIFGGTTGAATAGAGTRPADERAEQEFRRELENFRQAYLKRDEAKFAPLFADDCVVTYSSGKVVGKADYVRAQMAPPQGQATRDSFEYEETVIHQYGDMIVLSSVSLIKGRDRNGAPVAVRQRGTTTSVRRQGRWVIVAMHLTILP